MEEKVITLLFPKKIYDINFKNYYAVILLLTHLYSRWCKNNKKPLELTRSEILAMMPTMTKHTLWLYLKELREKEVINLYKKDYLDGALMIIDFTDKFLKDIEE